MKLESRNDALGPSIGWPLGQDPPRTQGKECRSIDDHGRLRARPTVDTMQMPFAAMLKGRATNENKRAPIEIGDRPLRRDPPPADNPEHRGNFMSKNTIAYLINQYPKVSHTFIRREIAALERE